MDREPFITGVLIKLDQGRKLDKKKLLQNGIFRRHERKTFLFITILFILFSFSETALATNASASLSATEGLITVNNSASFNSYSKCNKKKPPECTTKNSGKLFGYLDGRLKCSDGGNGSAFCSYEINAARLSNGPHKFTAKAVDYKQVKVSNSVTIDIDNTPKVTITTPSTNEELEGRFDSRHG